MPHMNDRLLFYHVPKTGGRWVLAAMKRAEVLGVRRAPRIPGVHPYGLRRHHATPSAVGNKCKKGRFQFCFVRRPYEWYRSFWCYRMRTQHPDPHFSLDAFWDQEFETFLENVLAAFPNGYLTQIYQCYVGPTNTWMNFVGRQENLVNDLVTALTLAGETIDEGRLRHLKPMNASLLHLRDRAIVGSSMIERIEASESWILKTFYGDAKCS